MCVVSVVSSRRRSVQTASQRRTVPAYRWEVTTLASAGHCLAEELNNAKKNLGPLQGLRRPLGGRSFGACSVPDVT
jgi:hypothetical protein